MPTSSDASFDTAAARPPQDWRFPRPFGARAVAIIFAALVLLSFTGARLDMGRMAISSAEGLMAAVGMKTDSEVASGFGRIARSIFPLQIEERTPVGRIEGFDRAHLPLFSHIETVETRTQHLDPLTFREETTTERAEVLVQPVGYLAHVAAKMVETLEIALWGTVLAVLVSVPLAILGARNFSPHPAICAAVRTLVSAFRALPELVSALFLVLAYGFGPIAGVLALAIHGVGFLGKFYAEDIENADPKPQEALRAIGASRLKVLRFAVWPQVAPAYVAYTLYVLDRNVRMATVIGLVGAGGVGQELKGRYDMFNYGHVGTILAAIFLLVFALDQLSSRLRRLWL